MQRGVRERAPGSGRTHQMSILCKQTQGGYMFRRLVVAISF